MDPQRVRAYLQAACAGLGFDVGEIWRSTGDNGSSSTVAAIEETVPRSDSSDDDSSAHHATLVRRPDRRKRLRFVQLYTSKSFESRRADLINPHEDEDDDAENVDEHVLSPRLVQAITTTAQVVWANTKKREGLTGRSDIRLQTAVGMPVAADAETGEMCVVLMFSPEHIVSTDDRLNFLRSIATGAAAAPTRIPCLLPVFPSGHGGLQSLAQAAAARAAADLPSQRHGSLALTTSKAHFRASANLGEGISARILPIGGSSSSGDSKRSADHNLATAPKDTFGIPMLPMDDEEALHVTTAPSTTIPLLERSTTEADSAAAFDESSYGLWSAIMTHDTPLSGSEKSSLVLSAAEASEPLLLPPQQERMEEFCQAFLGLSGFGLAETWVPRDDGALRLASYVPKEQGGDKLEEFAIFSTDKLVEHWKGAVGRCFAKGDPEWSIRPDSFCDPAREEAFGRAHIKTVLAVPVYGAQRRPACVVAFYSQSSFGSMPFVLRFVQQALRLVWDGQHDTVVRMQPADMGKMAADVKMQQHFMSKKRPHSLMASPASLEPCLLETTESPVPYKAVHDHLANAVRSMGNVVPFEIPTAKRQHVTDIYSAPLPSAPPARGGPVSPVYCPPVGTLPTPSMAPPAMPVSSTQTGHRMCRIKGCQEPAASKRPHCVRHSGNRICEHAGCKKCAQGATRFCIAHGGGRRCTYQGCDKGARDKFFCAAHGGGKRCKEEGCNKSAVGGSKLCTAHGGGRRCATEGCSKSAQSSTRFCVKHGGGKQCSAPNCGKVARGRTLFCAAHGGGVRCKLDGCNRVAIGKQQLCKAHGGRGAVNVTATTYQVISQLD